MSFLVQLVCSFALYIIVFAGIICWRLRFAAETALYEEREQNFYKEEADELYAMYVDENGVLHEVFANPW